MYNVYLWQSRHRVVIQAGQFNIASELGCEGVVLMGVVLGVAPISEEVSSFSDGGFFLFLSFAEI